MNLYSRIIQMASEQPWALAPKHLGILADILRFRSEGRRLTEEQIKERIAAHGVTRSHVPFRYVDPESDESYQMAFDAESGAPLGYRSQAGAAMPANRPVVAVIPVVGVIMQRGDALSEMSGAMSIQTLANRFRGALADPNVRGIVFDVDSPGGGVYGVDEFAAEIRAARSVKPIGANANSLAASAGYWIHTAAEHVSVTRSGEVGSIGVYSLHENIAKLLENEGVSYEFISAGEFKTEGNPFGPLTEEARAFMQKRVDEYYAAFLKAVAAGRGVSVAKVREDFGQGRVYGAAQAKEVGMVDRIETLDEMIRRIGAMKAKPSGSNASSAWAELNAAQADADRMLIGQ